MFDLPCLLNSIPISCVKKREMVGRKKKTKILSHEEDRISQLPESLICDNILCYLSTKDAVRTSVLSTRWRNLWRWVPGLDLNYDTFSNFDAFVRFVERFFDSHRGSWIRKLRLSFAYRYGMCDLTSWIDAVTLRRIQHLDVHCFSNHHVREIPLSVYTCETLVHLRLCQVTLCNAEFVALPCLKIMHLTRNSYPNKTILQKLISGSPVLEDLTIIRYENDDKASVLQVRSHTLKRAYINGCAFVIDAPTLQCLKATVSSPKNFQIINLGVSAKLVIDFPGPYFGHAIYSSSMIHGILTDIARVRELVISNHIWKEIFQYSESGPVFQFRDLSRLNVKFSTTDLEMLPTLLESCPKLESFILELVRDHSMHYEKNREPKALFSAVPRCMVTSLKFVEWKRSIPRYEGETQLVRYFLKNSTILEKLRLDVYYSEKTKCGFLKEVLTMLRCSSVCEIHCSFIAKK